MWVSTKSPKRMWVSTKSFHEVSVSDSAGGVAGREQFTELSGLFREGREERRAREAA
jgi:hypothetical protein